MRSRCLPAVAWFFFGLTAFCSAAAPNPAVQPPKDALDYPAPPRPTDGANMALTVQKLERGFDPDRPLLIWAIGSSFTNGLGNGDLLIELIRQRFPHAPPMVYKRMAGNSTSYHFSHGWARHLVIPDQPDVVLIYNFGKTEDVDAMIAELRRHTTADILVGSLHWCLPHKPVWPDPEARNGHQEPAALRAMCEKYGVEFVENRREMTQYMVDNGLVPEDLLADSVHENRYASKMTVMNIARHFHRAEKFAYDPQSRERRVEVESPAGVEMDAGQWTAAEGGAARTATGQGSELSVQFTGNRIELIGWSDPRGGAADVWIDGKPAAEIEAFCVGYIQPDKQNAPLPPNPPRDRCPHAVSLGANLVPQTWTMTMTSDIGDYELVGSVTGPDGSGNGLKPFTSKSGQIVVDPAFWRDAKNNRSGDRFTFEVRRATAATVDFKSATRQKFRLRLADYLPNGPHVVKLVARDDGPLTVDAFDVFQPPLK
ncbi:MAG: SGNH/GDSL hydrolase family protein [Candidatus Anammoximicrobium sp.]|mgnify:CR=1 FL=1|nr:SGNH/GDSL hydrolase family protein [Candidatus Anammoximicrobium sp.]